jgi:uncharacterized protein
VAADDLSAPLGQSKSSERRRRLPAAVGSAIAGLLALMLGVFLGWMLLVDDPLGGEPVAVVTRVAPPPPPRGSGPESKAQPERALAGGATVTIIDGMSGKRQDVPIGPSGKDAEAAPASGPEAGRAIDASKVASRGS